MDTTPLIDPEIAAALAALPIDLGQMFSGLTTESVVAIRAAMSAGPTPALSDRVERVDHHVPDTEGVVVRVHRPRSVGANRPCIYWMHGGGLVLGSYAGDDERFDRWCQMYDCVGVSVEYRLSPETPYPGPLDDCYAGLGWLHEHAGELGIDPSRIGVGGASAGGGLAAGLALLARDRGQYPIAFQLLIYPMIDDRQITPSSSWPDPIWPPAANTFGWTSYLGEAKGTDAVSHYAAAARATDLSGLPPTFVAVGAIDGFSDEDIDYAVRLRHAGVPVELHVYPGAVHGFDSLMAGSAVAIRASTHMEEWLRNQIGS